MSDQIEGDKKDISELLELIERRLMEEPDQAAFDDLKRLIAEGEITPDALQEIEGVTNWLLDMAVKDQA